MLSPSNTIKSYFHLVTNTNYIIIDNVITGNKRGFRTCGRTFIPSAFQTPSIAVN